MCCLVVSAALDPKLLLSIKEWEILSAYLELLCLTAFVDGRRVFSFGACCI